jgi:hypothetical protein
MDHEQMSAGTESRVNRRGALKAGCSALAGLFLAVHRRGGSKAGSMHIEDYCYWKRFQGPICTGHQAYEYQCEYCCGGGTCETVECGWYITGTC